MKHEDEMFGLGIACATILIVAFLSLFLLPSKHGIRLGEQCYTKGTTLAMCQREQATADRDSVALGWGYAYQRDPKNEREVSKEYN